MEKYYIAPSDEVFEEIKQGCITIWNTYDDKGGYRSSKIERIEELKNISDNAMYMVAMFDPMNQRKLLNLLGVEAKEFIKERLI